MAHRSTPFDHWSTGTKLLVLLTLALFPLGLALAWTARTGLAESRRAVLEVSYEDGLIAARASESLIARNALALRIAANGAIRSSPNNPCTVAAQTLALTPAVAARFSIRGPDAVLRCTQGEFRPSNNDTIVAPGALILWIAPEANSVRYRVGINGGMATGEVTAEEFARAIRDFSPGIGEFSVSDGRSTLDVIRAGEETGQTRLSRYPIAGGQLTATVRAPVTDTGLSDRLLTFLPLLMWVIAALLSWVLVRRLLLMAPRPAAARRHRLSTRRRFAGPARTTGRGDGNPLARRVPSNARSTGWNRPSNKWRTRSTASAGWSARSITG